MEPSRNGCVATAEPAKAGIEMHERFYRDEEDKRDVLHQDVFPKITRG
jgi:hypothetical protein